MKRQLTHVEDFHRTFKINLQHQPIANPSDALVELRHRLMSEENDEYLEAAKNGNLTEVADALGDQLYILCGTILTHGLQHVIEEVFEEIQRSNMSKLDEQGEPIFREDGKIMKSALYFKPNIEAVLANEKSSK